ncbi:hypothetical protein ACA910_012930 [Epithemia clementina (nom. ined.)]
MQRRRRSRPSTWYLYSLCLILSKALSSGQEIVHPFLICPSDRGELVKIAFAGDKSTTTIVQAWKTLVENQCLNYNVELVGTSADAENYDDNDRATSVARMLCGQNLIDDEAASLQVNGMSRNWDETIDNVELDFNTHSYMYDCGGSNREATQFIVGYEVAALAVARNSTAAACLATLLLPGQGDNNETGGLTVDQVRWIFSSYSVPELSASTRPWNPETITSSSRTWNELNPNDDSSACSSEPILIALGPDSDLYDFVQHQLFDVENGETFNRSQESGNVTVSESFLDLFNFVQETATAIGIFNYDDIARDKTDLLVIPLLNPSTQTYVLPKESTYSVTNNFNHTTLYQPLSRPLYLNVLTNDNIFKRVHPMLEAGFSLEGDQALRLLGKVPISLAEKYAARAKLASPFIPDSRKVSCGTFSDNSGIKSFSMAGSTSVKAIASVWAAVYQAFCPHIVIEESYSGSTDGVNRVCQRNLDDNDISDLSTDLSLMSREWDFSKEATSLTSAGTWMLNCSGSTRKVIQVTVAMDGLTLAVSNATGNSSAPTSSGDSNININAKRCIAALGGGLTRDQLRWIFSSFNETQLLNTGWDQKSATPNSDNNPETRLWSELLDDSACVQENILMTVSDLLEGSPHFLEEYLFKKDEGERFDFGRMTNVTGISYRTASSEKDTINYILTQGNAIGFIAFSNYSVFGYDLDVVQVPDSGGKMISPSRVSIESGVYPLIRRLYMSVLDSSASLELTRPFIEFGLSPAGQQLVDQVGSHSLTSIEATVMQTRAQTASGVPLSKISNSSHLGCAKNGFSIAGSSTVFPVAELWSGVYEVACDIDIRVSGGGSSVGAGRVCGNEEKGSPVEIGDMSREWAENEAVPNEDEPSIHQCVKGDKSRSVIQCRVATDGLTVVVPQGGVGEECIQILGGLTIDQLRWIYTDASDEDLRKDKDWDPNSVPNSDNNELTHLWSELDPRCARQEIQISGADSESGTYEYFKEVVFPEDSGESFDLQRPAPYVNHPVDEVLVEFLIDTPSGISYFGYAYFYTRQSILTPVPIKNPETGQFVLPSEETLANGSYKPFARPIYMNLLNDPEVLSNTYPFLQFGYSAEGSKLVEKTGYVPVDARVIYDTLNLIADQAGLPRPPDLTVPPPIDTPDPPSSGDSGLETGVIVGIAAAGFVVLVVAILVVCKVHRDGKAKSISGFMSETKDNNCGIMEVQGAISEQPRRQGARKMPVTQLVLPPAQLQPVEEGGPDIDEQLYSDEEAEQEESSRDLHRADLVAI